LSEILRTTLLLTDTIYMTILSLLILQDTKHNGYLGVLLCEEYRKNAIKIPQYYTHK